jgi:hypothetical protein
MSERKKETFKITKELDGQKTTTEYAVLDPRPVDAREAQKLYNATFAEVLGNGGLLRQRLSTYMREQGLWDDAKEAKQTELVEKLNELELTLQRGGIKLQKARELALDMRRTRAELRTLIAERNELDTSTAEGQAENARFNALVARCLVYNESGEPVYKDVDDYLEHGGDEEAFAGAQALASMLYSLDKNHDATLAENKFLKKWRFVDDEYRLVNKDGHLVDTEGRLINEDGHYVDENDNLVDVNGNPVDDDGNYKVESSPFLDDDGNPLPDPDAEPESEPEAEEEPAPTKVKTKTKTAPPKDEKPEAKTASE